MSIRSTDLIPDMKECDNKKLGCAMGEQNHSDMMLLFLRNQIRIGVYSGTVNGVSRCGVVGLALAPTFRGEYLS